MAKSSKPERNRALYERQAEICSALANPIRLEILDLLAEGEKTSSQLLEQLPIPKANLSQHITVLKDAGILISRKEGLYQYLSLSVPKIKDACSMVRAVLLETMAAEEKLSADLMKELKAKKG